MWFVVGFVAERPDWFKTMSEAFRLVENNECCALIGWKCSSSGGSTEREREIEMLILEDWIAVWYTILSVQEVLTYFIKKVTMWTSWTYCNFFISILSFYRLGWPFSHWPAARPATLPKSSPKQVHNLMRIDSIYTLMVLILDR